MTATRLRDTDRAIRAMPTEALEAMLARYSTQPPPRAANNQERHMSEYGEIIADIARVPRRSLLTRIRLFFAGQYGRVS